MLHYQIVNMPENPPFYETCDGSNSYKKKCTRDLIYKYVNKNLDINKIKCLEYLTVKNDDTGEKQKKCIKEMNPGINRIFSQFVINSRGEIINIDVRAPYSKVKDEIKKVLKALPVMKPASTRGKKVNVKYSLPITIKID